MALTVRAYPELRKIIGIALVLLIVSLAGVVFWSLTTDTGDSPSAPKDRELAKVAAGEDFKPNKTVEIYGTPMETKLDGLQQTLTATNPTEEWQKKLGGLAECTPENTCTLPALTEKQVESLSDGKAATPKQENQTGKEGTPAEQTPEGGSETEGAPVGNEEPQGEPTEGTEGAEGFLGAMGSALKGDFGPLKTAIGGMIAMGVLAFLCMTIINEIGDD